MKIAVAIIWRPTSERERAFRHVSAQYRALFPDAPIIAADAGGVGFSRAESRNVAMRSCSDYDVVILSDADCVLAHDTNINAAVVAATGDPKLHLPYTAQHYCTAEETELVYGGDSRPLPGWEGTGACYVVTPAVWEACGGMDHRFGPHWGGEDDALYAAATALTGIRRHYGTVLSLHHADEDRPIGSPSQVKNHQLSHRYHLAREDPNAIRAIIEERTS